MSPRTGILAYGSLIDDPGDEIGQVLIEAFYDVPTPFHVEFARKSRTRGYGPTLVPVGTGGASVRAAVLVIEATPQNAADLLWRRETRTEDTTRGYSEPRPGQPNKVQVKRLEKFCGLEVVLYTSISTNIDPLTAGHLADLAIASVAQAPNGKDGISYLVAAKSNGIITPLSDDYEREILARSGAATLNDAIASLK